MSRNKSLNDRVDQWIIANPKKPNETGYYNRVAQTFGIHPEKARKRWRMLQRHGAISTNYLHIEGTPVPEFTTYVYPPVSNTKIVSVNGNQPTQQDIQFDTEEPIESLDDLIRVSNIDVNVFDVIGYQIKSYTGWTKNAQNEAESKKLFSVRATLKVKKVDNSFSMQKDLILSEIKKYSPKVEIDLDNLEDIQDKDCALEINIPDLHIGKLAWGKETGEDYDINIAVKRYQFAVKSLVKRVNRESLEKIILPVGNDMINVDSKSNTTTAGTPQSCDSRFGKMFQTAKGLLIETIDYLSKIAPVEIIIVPGNHDTVSMFTLGEVLDAWYHNNDLVTVINTHTPRKYIQYGVNGLMYTHGDRVRLNELGLIFATEQPQLWADTKYRICKIGHFHKTKKLNFISVDEFQGFQVEIIPSLSGTDAWHSENGYMSIKAAKSFLYHKEKGKIAEYTYNV